MSTTNVESWAVDLAEVGPIYPWVGTEGIMFVVCVVLWIAWHIWQIKFESKTYEDEDNLYTPENIERELKGETYLHH